MNSGVTRDAWLDNAKLFGIACVVFGHMLEPGLHDSAELRGVYTWIYAWHMPLFVLLAGLLSRPPRGPGDWLASWVPLLVTYAVFQTIYRAFDVHVSGQLAAHASLFVEYSTPRWILWFLFSLATWRALVPMLALTPRTAVGLGFLGALAIGMTDARFAWSLSRSFYFLGFFALGFALRELEPERLRAVLASRPARAVAALILVAAAFAVYFLQPDYRPLWGRDGYARLGSSVSVGLAQRAGALACATGLVLAVLAWVPARRSFVTRIGAASLYVYLLHGLLVRSPVSQEVLASAFVRVPWSAVVGTALVAFAATLALGSAPVVRVLQPVVEPPLGAALRALDRRAHPPKCKR